MTRIFLSWLLCLAVLATAQTSQRPELSLNAFRFTEGDTLELDASGLTPNADYDLTFTSPDSEMLSEQLTTSPEGTFSYETVTARPGFWQLALQGDGIDAQFRFEVVAATPATEEAPAEETVQAEDNVTVTSESDASEASVTQDSGAPLDEVTESEATADEPAIEAEDAENVTTEVEPPVAEDSMETADQASDPGSEANEEPAETPMAETEDTTEAPSEPQNGAATGVPAPDSDNAPEETEPVAPVAETEDASAEEAPIDELDAADTPAEDIETSDAAQDESVTTSQTDATDESPVTNLETETLPALPIPPMTEETTFELERNAVVSKNGRDLRWDYAFPPNSGEPGGAVLFTDALFVGHGNSIIAFSPETGEVINRWLVSGQITELEAVGGDLAVTVTHLDDVTETFNLANGQLDKAVVFGSNPDMFSWLENEAKVVDPLARLARDDTNPWLLVEAARDEADAATRVRAYEAAAERATTFYDLAGISQELAQEGAFEQADTVFNRAMQDFADRGYDPRLLRDDQLHKAYNLPAQALQDAISEGDAEEAAFWADKAKLFLVPGSVIVSNAMSDYSAFLRRNGDRDASREWRELARSTRNISVNNILDNLFGNLARVGWYSAIAMLVAIGALWLTLFFKYWIPQGVILRRRKTSAVEKSPGPLARFFTMRYFSFTEKLVILLLLATTLALAGLAAWNAQGGGVMLAGNNGTLLSASAQESLADSNLAGPDVALLKGLIAQQAGDLETARAQYTEAGDLAAARNNLGVLDNDPALYGEALTVDPSLDEATYNLGELPDAFPFQQSYKAGQPIVAVPNLSDMQAALSGTWQSAIGKMFINPWTGLMAARPAAIPLVVWIIMTVLFLLLCLVTVILLFWPRPRLANNAPRTLLYHLFSILIPGSGLADEMWGILLLVPWAIVGIDTLADLAGWGFGLPGLSLRWDYIILIIIYAINLIAVIVEFVSYRRRMQDIKKNNPELAQEFRMIR